MNKPAPPADLLVAQIDAAFTSIAFAARQAANAMAELAFVATLALDDYAARQTVQAASDAIDKASGKTPP